MSVVAERKKLGKKKNSVKAKSSPWVLVFGAVAIIGLMFLLSSPIDPNAIK